MSLTPQVIDPRLVPAIAPGEVKDYGLDWEEFLAEATGDSIQSSAWACTGATLSGASATGTSTKTMVAVPSSAELGASLALVNTITTIGGRTAIRTLTLRVYAL
jgi:hypothetical protein